MKTHYHSDMTDPLNHPELLPLLRAAASAQKLLREANPDSKSDIEEALRDIQLELGKRVIQLAGALPEATGPEPLKPLVPQQELPRRVDSETVELLSNTDTFDEPNTTPIPESTPLPDDLDGVRGNRLPPPVSSPASSGIPDLPEAGAKPWQRAVVQAMHLLESPRVMHAYTDLSAENARLLWASYALDGYLGRIPSHLTGPILNLLAARCHHLSSQIELQWGPEATLMQLNRVAKNQNLDNMAAFSTPPHPEYQTWFEDALHWWDVLAHGMHAQLQ